MPPEPVPAGPLTEWLRGHAPDVRIGGTPIAVERIAGGHSNLTYRVTDAAGTPWALRRPPLASVLPTAHDMSREWRFLVALAPTAVPVPQPVAYCADPAVLGAEFYVMRFVAGDVLDGEAAGRRLDPAVRRSAAFDVVDVLAELHGLDPEAVGLGDLRRTGGYLERQLRRWHARVHATAGIDLTGVDLTVVDAAHARLVRWAGGRGPAEPRIVHGDYRFGNLAVGGDGAVRAVFDWELATLGDPLADLGWLLASWAGSTGDVEPIVAGPDLAGGYPDAGELAMRYAQRAGHGALDPDDLRHYVAFARWRVACIQAGVQARYLAGAMGDPEDAGAARARLTALARQAEAALALLGG